MPTTCQVRTKTTYSSFTKYCFQKGTLSKEIEKSIPRSTRHTWRKQSVSLKEDCLLAEFESKCLDYVSLFTENQKTKVIVTSLTEIILLHQKIIDAADNKKQLLAKNKQLILEMIDKLRAVFNLKKSCEYLAISTHQYYSWKNNMDCKASLLKLCRKKFPTQLTNENVNVIKLIWIMWNFNF